MTFKKTHASCSWWGTVCLPKLWLQVQHTYRIKKTQRKYPQITTKDKIWTFIDKIIEATSQKSMFDEWFKCKIAGVKHLLMFTNLNRRSLIGSNRPQTLQASAQKKLMHVFPDRPRPFSISYLRKISQPILLCFSKFLPLTLFFIGNLPPALTQGVDWVALAANELRF